jgi:uncharacterized membrane protein
MTTSAGDLWNKLSRAGVASGDMPTLESISTPWYVRVLLGFSGWLAALFILLFIGAALSFVFRSIGAAFISGVALIGGAYAMLRSRQSGDFLEQLALATSLAGQGLVVYAIFRTNNWNGANAWFLVAVLQVFLAGLMPNFIHRVFSAFFAAFSLQYALAYLGMPYLFSSLLMIPVAFIWLNELEYPAFLQPMRAIGYGLVIGLIDVKGSALFGARYWWMHYREKPTWVQPWMDEALAGAVILIVVWQLLRRYKVAPTSRTAFAAFAATIIAFGASLEANGISVGVLIVLLGFAGGNRILLGFGIAALLFFVSSYYYMTDTSLLVKSYTMAATGVVLLGLRWSMRFLLPENQGGSNA